jgi:hypothetical protein
MQATSQNFQTTVFINRHTFFIALSNFYARHLGVKVTEAYSGHPETRY